MRASFRYHDGNRAYWQLRWDQIPADSESLNLHGYPGKYAEAALALQPGRVLEAGCGAGRVLRHYHRLGRDIVGMDFIASALTKIGDVEAEACLVAADAKKLPFSSGSFSVVLAFGLFHNLKNGFDEALIETRRILEPGGVLCASLRLDNLQNRVVDWLANHRTQSKKGEKKFHKMNYTPRELRALFSVANFSIENFEFVENMPFLYQFRPFRHQSHRRFDEHVARSEGYKLSPFGQVLQNLLVRYWQKSFCNIAVITARAEN